MGCQRGIDDSYVGFCDSNGLMIEIDEKSDTGNKSKPPNIWLLQWPEPALCDFFFSFPTDITAKKSSSDRKW